jgi:hypothetical protein
VRYSAEQWFRRHRIWATKHALGKEEQEEQKVPHGTMAGLLRVIWFSVIHSPLLLCLSSTYRSFSDMPHWASYFVLGRRSLLGRGTRTASSLAGEATASTPGVFSSLVPGRGRLLTASQRKAAFIEQCTAAGAPQSSQQQPTRRRGSDPSPHL